MALVDAVIMFSGGADSLAAVIEAVQAGKKPLLVSHRPAPNIDSRQVNLVKHLQERFPKWTFPHVSMCVNRQDQGGRGLFEPSQRSRSFLFTSLGVVCASLISVDDVRLCDNGVVSVNLPRSGQNYGSMLSRSTHPRYVSLVQELLRHVTGNRDLAIENTLLFKTKRDVLEGIATSGHPELIQETVSCAHVEGQTKLAPHCGVCSQCIDRRFASVAAGLEEHDLPTRYEKDIFTHALTKGIDRAHAENYVRFAHRLESHPHSHGLRRGVWRAVRLPA